MARRRQRRRAPPAGLFITDIETLAHDGRGIGRINGKTVFIHGALPGERVEFSYSATHSQYDEGRVETLLSASTERVVPRCAHFGVCGGCVLQHLNTTAQISHKQDWLLDNLKRIGKVTPATILPPLTGPHWHYRHKARLGVKYVIKKERVLVGFREREAPFIADLERCEVLAQPVSELLIPLAELIGSLSIYNRLAQIEVAIGDDPSRDTALSFRVLDAPNDDDQAKLIAFGQQHGVQIYLQPKGPATTMALWTSTEAILHYRLDDFDLDLQFLPYHFTQINPAINRPMILRALALLELQPTDTVLDLFCGLGNFSLPLARRAQSVLGIEGEPSLVDWAQRNASANGINNVSFQVADLTADNHQASWRQGQTYNKVLLDPPRSGALTLMPQLAALGAQRVVYVSCHPATLARDVGELVHQQGYRLVSAGIMDMFPHTAHVESIALLVLN